MMTAISLVVVALLVPFAQTAWALTHQDKETGAATGLHIGGVPFELVLGVGFYGMGEWLLTGVRADLAIGIGLGALAAYAGTWGKAIGFTIVAIRQARDLGGDDDR